MARTNSDQASTIEISGTRDGWRKTVSRRHAMMIALPAFSLIVLAAVLRLAVGPLVERLPADYSNEIVMVGQGAYRNSPSEEMHHLGEVGRQTEKVIDVSNGVAIIQAGVDWSDESGSLLYQTSGVYGVDRQSRRNLTGLGNRNRIGQFHLPPHFGETGFQLWDAYSTAPRTATFMRTDELDGLLVNVYRLVQTGIDETSSYEYLPDVPERYKGLTDSEGTLWVEPVSGVIVDFTDAGHSYFADPVTNKSAGDFQVWNVQYAPETKTAHLRLARSNRARLLAVEWWLPGALLGSALLWLAAGFCWSRWAALSSRRQSRKC